MGIVDKHVFVGACLLQILRPIPFGRRLRGSEGVPDVQPKRISVLLVGGVGPVDGNPRTVHEVLVPSYAMALACRDIMAVFILAE